MSLVLLALAPERVLAASPALSEAREPGQGGGITIEWSAPRGCPDSNWVRAATARILGQKLETMRDQQIVARAAVVRKSADYWELVLHLSSGDSSSRQTLAAKHCRALADAVALKVALLADPLAQTSDEGQKAEAEPKPELKPDSTEPAPPPASRPEVREESAPLKLGIRGAFALAIGPLPGVTPGAALFPSLGISWFRAELAAELFWAGNAEYATLGVGADLQLGSLGVRVCASPLRGDIELPLCLGAEGGAMRGTGYGVADAETAYSPWAAVSAGPALRLSLRSKIALWVEGDAVLTVLRPSFKMRNLEELHRAPIASARIFAGVEFMLFE